MPFALLSILMAMSMAIALHGAQIETLELALVAIIPLVSTDDR